MEAEIRIEQENKAKASSSFKNPKFLVLENGEKICYRQAESKNDKYVICLHGLLTSSFFYENLIQQLTLNYHPIAIDFRGFGRSTYINKIQSLDDYVLDLENFINELKIQKFSIIAIDFGAAVSLLYTLKNANKVENLILINPIPIDGPYFYMHDENKLKTKTVIKNEESIEKDYFLNLLTGKADRDNKKWLLEKLILTAGIKDFAKMEKNYLNELLYERANLDVVKALLKFNISSSGTGEIKANKNRILIITGEKAYRDPEDYKTTMQELGDKAKFVSIKNTGSIPFLDDIEAFFLKMQKRFLLIPKYCSQKLFFSTMVQNQFQTPNVLTKNPLLKEKYENVLNNNEIDKKRINLINTLLSKSTTIIEPFSEKLFNYICDGKINSPCDLDKTLQFIKEKYIFQGNNIDWLQVENHCGIQNKMSEQELDNYISSYFQTNEKDLSSCAQNELAVHLRFLREKCSQAPAKLIFEKFNEKIKEIRQESVTKPSVKTQHNIWDNLTKLQARELVFSLNTAKNLEKFNSETKGELFFRFPPEPNGYLHLGHAKAMRINFGSAQRLGGKCFLRYDDTNPDKEEHGFKVSIEDSVKWLGHTIEKITHASDYFPQIIQYADQLILKGSAFVSDDTAEEMQLQRKNKTASKDRGRSIEENLKIFREMKEGLHETKKYCLRAKIDYKHANPTLRDPVICRIKNQNGIYSVFPCYDFTHCISDSLENITFSLCTLEFEIRRDLYYWYLDVLDLYKPKVYEYSRLNVAGSVLSKRKLKLLIENGLLDGWDDPRLLTLDGMKRRGYTPDAINSFCDLINASRNGNETQVPIHMLEHCLRKDLDKKVNRIMVVMNPVEFEIENLDTNKEFIVANHPKIPEKGERVINLEKTIYIEENDAESLQKDKYFGLKHIGIFRCTEVIKENGKLKKVKSEQIFDRNDRKIQYLHWISEKDSILCDIRVFSQLFLTEEVNKLESELEILKKHLNPKSKQIIKNCKFPKNALNSNQTQFQFERLGYFCIDNKDTNLKEKKIIINKSVSLK